MTLTDFLNEKPLYYDVIDYERMPRAYAAIQKQLQLPKIIHVVGTNGKGTTGRFIATALHRAGYDTGHYTSPHIVTFNERIWRNGANAEDATLEAAHVKLLAMLGAARAEALSYFEYTTLLAMVVYERCDWVVLEAGLGGEHDATNVFEKTLSVFTPIGMDHEAFLGTSIDAIAVTKLNSMAQLAVIGLQPDERVYAHYDIIARSKGARNPRIQEILEDADYASTEQIASEGRIPQHLKENLQLAWAVLKLLGIAVRPEWFENAALFGRMSPVASNVTVDVGHNELAAQALYRAIHPRKMVLVYNSFKDKDYPTILKILKPIVERVEIIDIDSERVVERTALEAALEAEAMSYSSFEQIRSEADYLVFGSFSVVEAFMRRVNA